LVGKFIVQTSVKNYGPWLILKPKNGVIPAFLKTLGDLSQYVYAAKYQTVVATGDRMGVGAGLYINAKSNKKVKCMIEDSTTGFVIYSGFTNLKFRRRSTCNVQVNDTQACSLNTVVNKGTIANRLRQAAPDQELLKKMIRNKPKIPPGLKGLPNQWIRSANAASTNTANTIANSIIKFKEYWGEDEANKLINAYGKLQGRISNTNKRAAIETIINGVLPENQKIRVNRTTGRINKVSSPPVNATKLSGTKRPSPNVTNNRTTPVSAPKRVITTSVNGNNRNKLRTYMDTLNRLTENNKKEYLAKLNTSGLNFIKIKNAAYNTHRIRVFNSQINKNKLTSNEYNNFVRRIKNSEKLQNVVNEAKKKASKNVVTSYGRVSRRPQ